MAPASHPPRRLRLAAGIALALAMIAAILCGMEQRRVRQAELAALKEWHAEARAQADAAGMWIEPDEHGIGPPFVRDWEILKLPACIEMERRIATNPRHCISLLREVQTSRPRHSYAIDALLKRHDPAPHPWKPKLRRDFFSRLFNPHWTDNWWPW